MDHIAGALIADSSGDGAQSKPRGAGVRKSRKLPTLVSVIMPVRNCADLLNHQLEALTGQTYEGNWEIVVADNGSEDDLAATIERWSPHLPPTRIVPASGGQGPSYGRNQGTRAARGDLLVFCDADDVASKDWLKTLVEAATEADVVAGCLEPDRLNHQGLRELRSSRLVNSAPVHLNFLPHGSSANLAIWRSVFESLGGWNQAFERAGGEDIDFCWRAQLAGYEFRFAMNAVMHYRYRSTLRGLIRQVYTYGHAEPRLYRDFRKYGLKRSPLGIAAKVWTWLVVHLPNAAFGPYWVRGRWARIFAYRSGRLVGSIHHRTLFL